MEISWLRPGWNRSDFIPVLMFASVRSTRCLEYDTGQTDSSSFRAINTEHCCRLLSSQSMFEATRYIREEIKSLAFSISDTLE